VRKVNKCIPPIISGLNKDNKMNNENEIAQKFEEFIALEHEKQREIAPILLIDLTKLFSMYVDEKHISLISVAAVSEFISSKMKNDGIELWQMQFKTADSEMLKSEEV
jgi:hypothetical protein